MSEECRPLSICGKADCPTLRDWKPNMTMCFSCNCEWSNTLNELDRLRLDLARLQSTEENLRVLISQLSAAIHRVADALGVGCCAGVDVPKDGSDGPGGHTGKMLEEKANELRVSKDKAYKERNQFVLFLTRCFPSHRCKHPESDTSWEKCWTNIICVHGPSGQMTWHIHDSELPAFEHLPLEKSHWDGHSTEEKYMRLYRCDMNSSIIGDIRRKNNDLHAGLARLQGIADRCGDVEGMAMVLEQEGEFMTTITNWETRKKWAAALSRYLKGA